MRARHISGPGRYSKLPRSGLKGNNGRLRQLTESEVADWFANMERILEERRPLVNLAGEAVDDNRREAAAAGRI